MSRTTTIERHRTETCPECQGTVHRTDSEAACADCGLVLADQPLDRDPG